MTETVAQAAELATVAPRMLDESRWADVLPAHIGPAKFQRWALGIMQKPELHTRHQDYLRRIEPKGDDSE